MEVKSLSRALLAKVLKGAQPLDPSMLKFRTRDQGHPLTYSKIIKTIQEEEALIAAKKPKSSKRHRQGSTMCLAQTCLGATKEVERGIPPVIKALTYTVAQMA